MSYWNAKYKNDYGEYKITFASKDYEKARAVVLENLKLIRENNRRDFRF